MVSAPFVALVGSLQAGLALADVFRGKIELAGNAVIGSGYCLHTSSARDGQQVTLEKCDVATTWNLEYFTIPSSTYQLSSARLSTDGKCLTSPNNDRTNGAILFLWECSELKLEEMYYHTALVYNGSGKWIIYNENVRVKSFKQDRRGVDSCADVSTDASIAESGTPMQIWDCSDRRSNPNQEFVWWNVADEVAQV